MASRGLVNVAGVETRLITEPELEFVSVSIDVFLLVRRGLLVGVLMLSSCHFNLTPYPLQVIFNRMHRPQYGFCSSHLYPASLQVQHPVLDRLCVAIEICESSLMRGYITAVFFPQSNVVLDNAKPRY
jgi:hypothetical protein